MDNYSSRHVFGSFSSLNEESIGQNRAIIKDIDEALLNSANVKIDAMHKAIALSDDEVVLRLQFYGRLSRLLKTAWKAHFTSHLVVRMKVSLTEYRLAARLPSITTQLSVPSADPLLNLFCEHLRNISRRFIERNFKNPHVKNFIADLYAKLVSRLGDLSEFCCFCDAPLAGESTRFPKACVRPSCAFHLAAVITSTAGKEGQQIEKTMLAITAPFLLIPVQSASAIVYETRAETQKLQALAVGRRTRLLRLSEPRDRDWRELVNRGKGQIEHIRLVDRSLLCTENSGIEVICEIIDAPEFLRQLSQNEYLVVDRRALRFRLLLSRKRPLDNGGEDILRTSERIVSFRNELWFFSDAAAPTDIPALDLNALSQTLFLRLCDFLSPREYCRLERCSKKLRMFLKSGTSRLPKFSHAKMNVHFQPANRPARIKLEIDSRLMEIELSVGGAVVEPMFRDAIHSGPSTAAWKLVRIVTRGHSLTNVIARLCEKIEVSQALFTFDALPSDRACELLGCLNHLGSIKELHLRRSRRMCVRWISLPPLPTTLYTLVLENIYPSQVFCTRPQVQSLRQLHIYGANAFVPEGAVLTSQISNFNVVNEECVILTEELRVMIDQWRESRRFLEVVTVNVHTPKMPKEAKPTARIYAALHACTDHCQRDEENELHVLRNFIETEELRIRVSPSKVGKYLVQLLTTRLAQE